ncbi:type II toxin-antitoxin system Y4mF family antitoxin [Actimicrobium antarcticum]|uniref:HTH cro/C1-type domain-containing protein n=1 Tax=Actimicrobium antarcticum TaxID=1051899 RepID=A0ABP7TTX2_9BURK
MGMSGNTATPLATLSSTIEVGELVRSVRKIQGLTQLDVAGLAGLSNRFVIDLEKGKATLQMQKVLDVLSLLGLEVVIRKKL